MAETKAMTTAPDYRTIVQKTSDALIPMIREEMAKMGIEMDGYQSQCAANAVTIINDLIAADGASINNVDRTSLVETLQQVAILRLNPFAQPRECYFIIRTKKITDKSTQETLWLKKVEMGIEGDGNDAILRNFGHDVEQVYPHWEVREGDDFKYPRHVGIDVTPPEWTQGGTGEVLRVVYPIRYKDGHVEYHIGEREDVRVNLMAHISNNLMNETFGIAKSRYDATVAQKKEIETKKTELLALAKGRKLDEILNIPELAPYISPAWKEDGRERMLVRKMRNNVVKPIPKDFANPSVLAMYNRSVQADEAASEQHPTRTVTVMDLPITEYSEVPEVQQLPPTAAEPTTVPTVAKPEPTAAPAPTRPAKAPF